MINHSKPYQTHRLTILTRESTQAVAKNLNEDSLRIGFKATAGLIMDNVQRKIANIHDYYLDFDAMMQRLDSLKSKFPTGLIIPIKGSDINNPGLTNMIEEINKCAYLKKVYIGFSTEEPQQYQEALKLCQSLKIPCRIVWCNKPEVQAVFEELKRTGLDVTQLQGKGKDVWITMGIASLEVRAFAVHDSDIVSYSKMLPTKLLYPIVEPKLDFFFSKGYYARINQDSRKLYGRINRLFINPLLEILQEKLHYSKFLSYMQSFSYPLSGEMAIYSDLALHLRMTSDWGLEIGLLAEIYRNSSLRRICQVDLGLYDHKHKEVIASQLLRTAEESFITLLRTLAEMENAEFSEAFLVTLQVVYKRLAQDKIRQHHADSICNNLSYDRHKEEENVAALANVLVEGARKYMADPCKAQLPDWVRVIAAMPHVRERLRKEAVEN